MQAKVDQNSHLSSAYSTYRGELVKFLIRRFGLTSGESADIVQSAFSQLVGSSRVVDISNLRAYLYKSCTNLAIDSQRRSDVRERYVQSLVGCENKNYDIDPSRAVESEKRLGLLARAMWAMPAKRRKLLIMSRFDGLSYAEISRVVGISESVVRKHIGKALNDCHKALEHT